MHLTPVTVTMSGRAQVITLLCAVVVICGAFNCYMGAKVENAEYKAAMAEEHAARLEVRVTLDEQSFKTIATNIKAVGDKFDELNRLLMSDAPTRKVSGK